jgi:outer membrane protein TolC
LAVAGYGKADAGEAPVALGRELSLAEFVRRAIAVDTEFEEILIDELALRYQKDINLPARDLVLDVRAQHNAYLSRDRDDPQATLELSKLFPYAGTEVAAGYSVQPSFSAAPTASEWNVTISQPVAQNAFGRTTRLLDRIVGLEVDVARHQVVEAYEDYLAGVIIAYYRWYETLETLRIAEESYRENLKLLDNIRDRQAASIALPVDVNKITLQVLARKESLVDLRNAYQEALNLVSRLIRREDGEGVVPVDPGFYRDYEVDFEKDYREFEKVGRTFSVLRLLEDKSSLDVERRADELLPSINLLFGYQAEGDGYRIEDGNDLLYGGVSLSWPFPDQDGRARHELARVASRKTKLSVVNTRYRLYTELRDLSYQIELSRQRAAIADEKIGLAAAVLEDEKTNYSYGRVSLNDYIQAVNQFDNNRFTKARQDALRRTLLVEWLRRTDRLVDVKMIKDNHSGFFQDAPGKRKDTGGHGQTK